MKDERYKKNVITYPIKSGGLYCEVVEERTVILELDIETCPRIYGEIPDLGESSNINLSELLLEFALSLEGARNREKTVRRVEYFGNRIGEALADLIKGEEPECDRMVLVSHAMDCILHSMGADYSVYEGEEALDYKLARCPLQSAAEMSGLRMSVESAHTVLNSICQGLVHAIDPFLEVHLPAGTADVHIIEVFAPQFENNSMLLQPA